MTDNDRELLERAARAAGIPHEGVLRDGGVFVVGGKEWNPLANDGDALRLAVTMELAVYRSFQYWTAEKSGHFSDERPGSDPYAATRRAIVRAAAAIGEGMK